jgi:glycosyltransferase involved in cell wall biosynthesis
MPAAGNPPACQAASGTMRSGVLVSSISWRAGGLLHSARRLAQQMEARERAVAAVFSLEDEWSADYLRWWQPLHVHLFPVAGPRWFGFAPGLLPCLRSKSLDMVHLHGMWMYPSVVALRWAASSRRPLVISPHGMLNPWALRQSAAKKRVARILFEDRNLRRAACLRSLCPAETLAFRRLGLKNRICEIPNGVDVPECCWGEADLVARRRAAGAPGKMLLYVGRLHQKKQLPSLLRAWKELERVEVAGRDDWDLVIVGWDQFDHREDLRGLIRDLQITRVHLLGPVFGKDLSALLFSASGFILPSISEGLPMVVLEAWAHRLPVVMTESCNLPEGFRRGAALRISTEAADISRAIAELIQMSEADRCQMGARGLDLVREKFAWPTFAGQMLAVYKWLLGGGPTPPTVVA